MALRASWREGPVYAPTGSAHADPAGGIWLHRSPDVSVAALTTLCGRLTEERPDLPILLTCAPELAAAETDGATEGATDGATERALAADQRSAVERFLNECRPRIVVLTGGNLPQATLTACADRAVPIVAIAARPTDRGRIGSLFADLRGRGRYRGLTRVLAASGSEADHFHRLGVDPSRVETGGILEPVDAPLSCDEQERQALSNILRSRPVWLAAGVPPEEYPLIDAAMRQASRLSHRLLLIAQPPDEDEAGAEAAGAALATMLDTAGWRVARRSQGLDPEDTVQIFIADVPNESGLWFRLSPITYLGGSHSAAGSAVDPFDPARLGSAIIHGPGPSPHDAHLRRLDRARGSRSIRSADTLAEGLLELLSPERAALLARRAWEETSRASERIEQAKRAILSVLGSV